MVNDPTTKAQAQALLNEYYEQEKQSAEKREEKSTLPAKPNLLSWNLRDDGTMIVVDGASGRKLQFAPKQSKQRQETPAERRARLKAEAAAQKEAES